MANEMDEFFAEMQKAFEGVEKVEDPEKRKAAQQMFDNFEKFLADARKKALPDGVKSLPKMVINDFEELEKVLTTQGKHNIEIDEPAFLRSLSNYHDKIPDTLVFDAEKGAPAPLSNAIESYQNAKQSVLDAESTAQKSIASDFEKIQLKNLKDAAKEHGKDMLKAEKAHLGAIKELGKYQSKISKNIVAAQKQTARTMREITNQLKPLLKVNGGVLLEDLPVGNLTIAAGTNINKDFDKIIAEIHSNVKTTEEKVFELIKEKIDFHQEAINSIKEVRTEVLKEAPELAQHLKSAEQVASQTESSIEVLAKGSKDEARALENAHMGWTAAGAVGGGLAARIIAPEGQENQYMIGGAVLGGGAMEVARRTVMRKPAMAAATSALGNVVHGAEAALVNAVGHMR